MAKKFNIPESYNPINVENDALKQHNRKISKLLPSQSIDNCRVSSNAEVTCEYPRSKIKKIIEDFKKLHKTNCDPSEYDPCDLDDTGLVIPGADIIVDVIKDKVVTVYNNTYTANCDKSYPIETYPENGNFYRRITSSYIVQSGIFTRRLVFPGDTDQGTIDSKVNQVQAELDAIAKAFGDSKITCGYTNVAIKVDCKENPDTTEGNAYLLRNISNGSSLNDGELTVYFSDDITYNKNLGNEFTSQICTLAISKLNCYYGNGYIQVECKDESGSNYSLASSTIINPITSIQSEDIIDNIDFGRSDFFINGEWNIAKYNEWGSISDKLTSLSSDITSQIMSEATTRLLTTATCSYVNKQTNIRCPSGGPGSQDWKPITDYDLDPNATLDVGSHIITLNINSDYLVKDYNTGPYSWVTKMNSTGQTYISNEMQAYINDATTSYQGYSCILYNNQVAAYCDASTANSEKDFQSGLIFSDENTSNYYELRATTDGTIYLSDMEGQVTGQQSPVKFDDYIAGTAHGLPIDINFIKGVIIYKNDWTTVAYTKEILTNPDRYNFSHCGECNEGEVVSDKCNNCTVYRDLSTYRYIVPAKTYITYYVDAGNRTTSEIQTELNTQAATQAISSINCLYGNKHLDSIPCTVLAKNCGASGVNNEISSPAPEVDENTYFANSPEDADVQAATAAIASAFCICYDWMGGGGGSSISIKQEGNCGDCNQQYCVFSE